LPTISLTSASLNHPVARPTNGYIDLSLVNRTAPIANQITNRRAGYHPAQ
jgi:hypothetical protein